MDALGYEYLIRKAYNCTKGSADGRAEGSIYQKIEKVENAIKARIAVDSNGEIEQIYRSASINVSMNVYDALKKVADSFHFTSENEKLKKRLEEMLNEIYMSTDKKIIDDTMLEAHQIFERLDLQMK